MPAARDPSIAAAVRAAQQYLATSELPPPPPTVQRAPPRKPVVVKVPPGVSKELATAQVVTRGLLPNALVIDLYTTRLMGETDFTACVQALEQTIGTVQQGDLGPADALLLAQATSLNAIYVQCASIASFNLQHPDVMERYLRLALRAQGQSRATLEALALLRNPTAIFAKQANIAQGPQQVNNVAAVTTAPEEPSRAREILGQTNYCRERLDAGTTHAAGGRHSAVAAVGAGHRPPHPGRQGAGRAERGSRRPAPPAPRAVPDCPAGIAATRRAPRHPDPGV